MDAFIFERMKLLLHNILLVLLSFPKSCFIRIMLRLVGQGFISIYSAHKKQELWKFGSCT